MLDNEELEQEQETEEQVEETNETEEKEETETKVETKEGQNLTKEEQSQVDQATELLNKAFEGNLPKGAEIWKQDGKLFLYTKENGQPKLYGLKDIIDHFSRNKVGDDKLTLAKKKEAELKDKEEKLRQHAQNLFKNPKAYVQAALKQGHSREEVAKMLEEAMEDMIKYYDMTPEERKIRELQEKLEASENEKKQREETEKTTKEKAEYARYMEETDKKIIEAMTGNGFMKGVNRNQAAQIMDAALHRMQMAIHSGMEDYSADRAIKDVILDSKELINTIFGNYDDSQIVKLLPDKVINAVIKFHKAKDSGTPTLNSLIPKEKVDYKKKESSKEDNKKSKSFEDWARDF